MKEISVCELRIRNFRSYRDEVVKFPSTSGLFLLTGENKVEPELGENGTGKSSLWDAISWCLQGVSIKGGRMSALITWGEEDVEVEGSFLVNNTKVSIRRYGPPMRIEVNGKAATQERVDEIIGLSKLRFLHSVVFGQGVLLFPDITISERGDLLDEVLSLNIWQKATEAASVRHKVLESSTKDKKIELSYIQGKLEALPTNDHLQEKIDEYESTRELEVAKLELSRTEFDTARKGRIENLAGLSLIWAVTIQERIDKFKADIEEWKTALVDKTECKIKQLENLEADLTPIQFEIENKLEDPFVVQLIILRQQLERAQLKKEEGTKALHKSEHELESCEKAEKFWINDTCPVCSQSISNDKKKHEASCIEKIKIGLQEKIIAAKLEIDESVNVVTSCTKQIDECRQITIRDSERKKSLEVNAAKLNAQIKVLESEATDLIKQHDNDPFSKALKKAEEEINPYTRQIQNVTEEVNPFIVQIKTALEKENPFLSWLEKVKKERQDLTDKLHVIETQYKKIESEMTATEYWKHGFKRIRLYFVQQVLATLELEIESALNSLGLSDWHVKLATETETKSATIKLGVQIHITSPKAKATWDVWSGGETQRLRLGIAKGVASLIQRAAGVRFTFEAWDEPTKALSGKGIDDLLEALRYRAEVGNKQIWITDHSNLQHSSFEQVWVAVKDTKGSRIEVAGK